MHQPARAKSAKDAVRDHLKRIELPARKHPILPQGFVWLAYRTFPGKERLAEFHLSRAGATAFLPMETKSRRVTHHSKRMVQVELPLLTRTLFVGFEPSRPKLWQEVCHLPMIQGVLAVWEMDGLLHPIVVAEAQMHIMLGTMRQMATANPRRSFGMGDLVRIKDGPFAGFFSRVQAVKGQSARLELHILGSVRGVDIPLEILEAA